MQVIQGDIGIHGVHEKADNWVARCTSKCCRRLCSPSSTWILQCTSSHVNSAKFWNHFLRILISFPRAEEIAVTVWFSAEPKNECESDQPMRAQLGSTPFPVRGRSSSFYFIPSFRTAWEGNISAWLRWRGRLHTLKQANFGVCSHFFSVSPQTTRNCVVGFLKKILQHPFAPTLLRRACTRVSPF